MFTNLFLSECAQGLWWGILDVGMAGCWMLSWRVTHTVSIKPVKPSDGGEKTGSGVHAFPYFLFGARCVWTPNSFANSFKCWTTKTFSTLLKLTKEWKNERFHNDENILDREYKFWDINKRILPVSTEVMQKINIYIYKYIYKYIIYKNIISHGRAYLKEKNRLRQRSEEELDE